MTDNTRFNLEGRVSIVTGAGQGLGKAYAIALARRGARVVVNDLGVSLTGEAEDGRPSDAVVEQIKRDGGDAVANYSDVSNPDGAASIVRTAIDTFGSADILINNAGVLRDKAFHNMAISDYEFVARVHLLGSAFVTRAAFPEMRKRSYGRIVMVTSTAALFGNFGQANYASAKMGVVGLAQTLAVEGERFNIKVNTIAPGATTRMTQTASEGATDNFSPESVAELAVVLSASECPGSGQLFTAMGQRIARAAIFEGAGWTGKEKLLTAESILDNWTQIAAIDHPNEFRSASDYMSKVFADFLGA